jgi:aldehyde dehydrogenase (NAD+)
MRMKGIGMERSAAGEIANARAYFNTGQTRSLDARLRVLRVLRQLLERYEAELIAAVETDMDKAPYETFMTEMLPIYREIDYYLKHLNKWHRETKKTKRSLFGRYKGALIREPYGVVYIISSWSNPLLDCLLPLVDALGAGNCVIIKTSQLNVHVTELLQRILGEVFSPKLISVSANDHDYVESMIAARPDFIFFTGRPSTGRHIMRLASRFMIPLALQMGGKNPCIVSESADIQDAAQKIIWGKLLNAGQTGWAPDYVFAHDHIKTHLIEAMIAILRSTYGVDPTHNPEYQRVSSRQEFDRLRKLMTSGRIMWGGRANEETLQVEPTIIDRVSWTSPVMREEIFGPVLPVLSYRDFSQTLQRLNQLPSPLCFYLFSQDNYEINLIKNYGRYGSCCINDTVMNGMFPQFPVGGIGMSGYGSYRGRAGFELFTYPRVTTIAKTRPQSSRRYPPYPQNWKRLRRDL